MRRGIGGDNREEPERTAKTAALRGTDNSIPSLSNLRGVVSQSLCPAGAAQTESPRREEDTCERHSPSKKRKGATARLASQVGSLCEMWRTEELKNNERIERSYVRTGKIKIQ